MVLTQSFLMCCAAVLCSGCCALIAAGWRCALIAAGWLRRTNNYLPDVKRRTTGDVPSHVTRADVASVLHALASSRFELCVLQQRTSIKSNLSRVAIRQIDRLARHTVKTAAKSDRCELRGLETGARAVIVRCHAALRHRADGKTAS